MYYFLSLLTGILISVMVAFNGGLTKQYGLHSATVIIHIVGLILITAVVLIKREKPFACGNPQPAEKRALYLYLGGAIGVLTTIFNNFSFGRISVSAILALGLFGQSIAGILIDQYGFFSMPKYPFSKRKLAGLLLILAGIGSMINNFEIIAVIVSFAAGINIVISRTLNAKLADLTSVWISTFFNYFIGLIVSIPVLFILGSNETSLINFTFSPDWHIYLGGVLGMCVVFIFNITVVKISAFYLTLFVFIGQVFSGALIDMIISRELSFRNLTGGLFVAAGLTINLLLDRKRYKEGKTGEIE